MKTFVIECLVRQPVENVLIQKMHYFWRWQIFVRRCALSEHAIKIIIGHSKHDVLQYCKIHHDIIESESTIGQILRCETRKSLTDSILVQHKVLHKSSVTETTWEQQTSRISCPSLLWWLMSSSQTTAGNFVVMDTVVHGSLSWYPHFRVHNYWF